MHWWKQAGMPGNHQVEKYKEQDGGISLGRSKRVNHLGQHPRWVETSRRAKKLTTFKFLRLNIRNLYGMVWVCSLLHVLVASYPSGPPGENNKDNTDRALTPCVMLRQHGGTPEPRVALVSTEPLREIKCEAHASSILKSINIQLFK